MTVFANGKSILHKGHGQTQLATAPDVCKTPSPGGPVPIPYPNMSSDSNLTDGAATVTIAGNPVANVGSTLSRSNGDEAGTAGGVVSSKNMGAFGWPSGSIDVQAEGQGVVRMLDTLLTNGNAYNDVGITLGTPQLGYGDDLKCPRSDCKLDHDIPKHRLPESPDISKACSEFAAEVDKGMAKKINRGPGRMVGVGLCRSCNQIIKAVSGGPLPDTHPFTRTPNFCNKVGPMADEPLFKHARKAGWSCAALKILSSGHQIIYLSEKWLGSKAEEGGRTPKTYTQKILEISRSPGLIRRRRMPHDKITGAAEGPIASGESVPSCGMCQAYLPALICEMKPCK